MVVLKQFVVRPFMSWYFNQSLLWLRLTAVLQRLTFTQLSLGKVLPPSTEPVQIYIVALWFVAISDRPSI